MKKIDIHTHILPKNWPDLKAKYGYGGFLRMEHLDGCSANLLKDDGTFFRKVNANCWDPEVRLEECEDRDVAVQVLSTVPVMFSYWSKPKDGLDLAKYLNDDLAKVVAKYPKRFIGLGTLPLQAPDLAVKELERCKRELGLAGVQIGSHVNEWNLNDTNLFPVFAAAQDLGMAIFVHPWDMLGQERMKQYWLPWLVGMPAELSLAICSMIFGGVLERLPKLRVAFAHGGGAFPFTLGRIQHGFEARPDLCAVDNAVAPRSYVGKFWVDSLVHDPAALRFLLEMFGDESIALGTDYPFPLGEQEPGKLIESLPGIGERTRRRLLIGNALAWLDKKEKDLAL